MKTYSIAAVLLLGIAALTQSVAAEDASLDSRCSHSLNCYDDGNYLLRVQSGGGQSYTSTTSSLLWAEFDARPLSVAEKRFLQAVLALQGYYNGLIDGAWGRGSQSALERFSQQTFDQEPFNSDAAYLTLIGLDAFSRDGWEPVDIDYLAISLMLPLNRMRMTAKNGVQEDWEHADKDISLRLTDLLLGDMASLHDGLERSADQIGAPYTVRQPDLWVTSVRSSLGTGYARSDLIGGTWSTVVIFGAMAHASEVGLVVSSIKVGPSNQILPENDGILIKLATELEVILNEDREIEQRPSSRNGIGVSQAPQDQQPVSNPQRSSGTGFFVSRDATMLTNAHVVEGCSSITVDGMPAQVISVSQAFDLAVIKPAVDGDVSYLKFAAAEAGLNADITIAGYPLYGLLGGLNVSRGSISSMTGLGGDETSVQISAPVQPGNSGGPVIDRGGNVVGVVVSKLDVMELAYLTGDIAQNVNFAIRGSMAKIFLEANGIPFETQASTEDIRPEQAAQVLQAATRLIQCVVD